MYICFYVNDMNYDNSWYQIQAHGDHRIHCQPWASNTLEKKCYEGWMNLVSIWFAWRSHMNYQSDEIHWYEMEDHCRIHLRRRKVEDTLNFHVAIQRIILRDPQYNVRVEWNQLWLQKLHVTSITSKSKSKTDLHIPFFLINKNQIGVFAFHYSRISH